MAIRILSTGSYAPEKILTNADLEKMVDTNAVCFDVGADDVKYLIPHQANLRIIKAVGRQLKISEDLVYANVERIVLTAFGAGLTWGAALLDW